MSWRRGRASRPSARRSISRSRSTARSPIPSTRTSRSAMSCGSRLEVWTLAIALLIAAAAPAAAQGWHETQLGVVGLTSRPAVLAGGLGLAWRDPGRTRLGFMLAAGAAEGGHAAGRAELAW